MCLCGTAVRHTAETLVVLVGVEPTMAALRSCRACDVEALVDFGEVVVLMTDGAHRPWMTPDTVVAEASEVGAQWHG